VATLDPVSAARQESKDGARPLGAGRLSTDELKTLPDYTALDGNGPLPKRAPTEHNAAVPSAVIPYHVGHSVVGEALEQVTIVLEIRGECCQSRSDTRIDLC
jgi:hypothetical protein